MSAAVGVLERNPFTQTHGQVTCQERSENFPVLDSSRKYYLESSEFYQLRGGFEAEVIQNPLFKFIEKGIMDKVTRDLQKVTLKAFVKPESQMDIFAPEDVVRKNAIFADWLTVIRKGTKIIAFGSQTHIGQNVLCLNSAMVDPEYQSKGAFGILMQMYIWQKILGQKFVGRENELRIVMRTRNKDVASIMTHVLSNVKISGDPETTEDQVRFYEIVANALQSPYEQQTGILRNVYPEGLPNGTNGRNEKINTLFPKLGAKDAYFVAGEVNMKSSARLLRRELERIYQLEPSRIELEPVEALAAA
ncbi:hypothetical protein KAR34_13975 [bacterium]|nr:hypothetical protein [bacterium]